jgi:hypothetical protein
MATTSTPRRRAAPASRQRRRRPLALGRVGCHLAPSAVTKAIAITLLARDVDAAHDWRRLPRSELTAAQGPPGLRMAVVTGVTIHAPRRPFLPGLGTEFLRFSAEPAGFDSPPRHYGEKPCLPMISASQAAAWINRPPHPLFADCPRIFSMPPPWGVRSGAAAARRSARPSFPSRDSSRGARRRRGGRAHRAPHAPHSRWSQYDTSVVSAPFARHPPNQPPRRDRCGDRREAARRFPEPVVLVAMGDHAE